MKHLILLFFLLGAYCLTAAQGNNKDSILVGKQVDAFFTSWNNHDFNDMKNYVADDCHFINVAGMHWKGREDIQYAHNETHKEIFKDKPLTKVSANIRFLTDDVAIVYVQMHLEGDLLTPDGSKQAAPSALATFVLLKKNQTWLITTVENVFIDKEAQPFNPITIRDKQANGNK